MLLFVVVMANCQQRENLHLPIFVPLLTVSKHYQIKGCKSQFPTWRSVKVNYIMYCTLMSGDTKPEYWDRTRWKGCPKALNSYWGCGSQMTASLCR